MSERRVGGCFARAGRVPLVLSPEARFALGKGHASFLPVAAEPATVTESTSSSAASGRR
jgi:hypothetical protein